MVLIPFLASAELESRHCVIVKRQYVTFDALSTAEAKVKLKRVLVSYSAENALKSRDLFLFLLVVLCPRSELLSVCVRVRVCVCVCAHVSARRREFECAER